MELSLFSLVKFKIIGSSIFSCSSYQKKENSKGISILNQNTGKALAELMIC